MCRSQTLPGLCLCHSQTPHLHSGVLVWISQPPSQLFVPALTSGTPLDDPSPPVLFSFPAFLSISRVFECCSVFSICWEIFLQPQEPLSVPWPGICRIPVLLEEQGEQPGDFIPAGIAPCRQSRSRKSRRVSPGSPGMLSRGGRRVLRQELGKVSLC